MSSFINVQYCYDYLVNQIPINLLFYTHLTVVVTSLIFSIYLLCKKRTLPSITLFIVCLSFVVWVLLDLSTWFAFLGLGNTMFTWELIYPFTLIFFFFSYYFLYTFITGRDMPIWQKILGVIVMAPTFIWAFLGYGLPAFEGNICEALENKKINDYYFFAQGIFFVATIILTAVQFRKNKEHTKKKQVILAGLGVIIFLSFFLFTGLAVNLLADYDFVQYAYNFSIYGLLGMPLLLGFLIYLIVKFKAFDIKLLATQALVWSLVILIGAQFLFIQTNVNRILTAITLIISGWLGLVIIRSVKKEIDAKEALAIANEKLKELDQLKSEFVSLATHQIRAPLSAIKGYLSEAFEGDFGPISKELEKPLQVVFQSTENLVNIVGDFLNISRIESGNMKYELAPVNLKQVVEETVKGLKPNFERAGLELKIDVPEGNYNVYADVGKVKQIIGNLIDNSMKYTPQGSIKISLASNPQTQKVLFAIADTGIGIAAEVIPKLFQKFTRAKGANDVNIIGTGLGLYVAKLMIEGQKGRVWAESPGVGKGSTFFVELPIAHVS